MCLHRLVVLVVDILKQEADGLVLPVHNRAEYLVELAGHADAVFPQAAQSGVGDDGSCRHVKHAVVARPEAALLLEDTPYASVKSRFLRADVAEVERFLHRAVGPFHVAGGSKVSLVEARFGVVFVECRGALGIGVGAEFVRARGTGALGFAGSQFVGDPVGDAVVGIIRNRITLVPDDLLGPFFLEDRNFDLFREGEGRGLLHALDALLGLGEVFLGSLDTFLGHILRLAEFVLDPIRGRRFLDADEPLPIDIPEVIVCVVGGDEAGDDEER